jgi:two-component system, sensor histidine kinase and response regulator
MDPLNKVLHVLLVDDDEDDYLIVRNIIGRISGSEFKLHWVSSLQAATQAITDAAYDVYLVDYRLGEMTGIELLNQFDLIQRPEPFIILTGAGDERVERQAMKMGVADYLVKGTFSPELLSRVMHYALERKRLESQRVKQLVELNRSKDEFIALASHQLRTPATAVKQYVGMLLGGYAGDISDQQREFLQSAYDNNERQINVVNDILRVAQLDLKRTRLNMKESDISAMVEGVIKDSAMEFKNRKQTITYDLPKQPVKAVVDLEQLRMAIGNIIDNASKYTPEGKAVSVSVASQADRTVAIQVKDEGVGINEKDQAKLFKKFSRIDNPLTVVVGGTGLGLYWAHEVVLMHGGHIKVTSKINKGTTFIIYLPPTDASVAK